MLAVEVVMVAPDERPADSYYSPDQVGFWVRNWALLESLAETPSSSRHLLTPECRNGEATSCSSHRPVGIRSVRGLHGDPLRYADIMGDLRAALHQLPFRGLGYRAVAERMQGGRPMDELAQALGARYVDVLRAYKAAIASMAKWLGWVESSP